MQTHQHIRKFGHQNVVVSSVVRFGGAGFLALLLLSALLSMNVMGVHAQTLNRHTANKAGTTGSTSAASASVLVKAASIASNSAVASSAPVGHKNVFPYPACTWGANQRYYQMHGYFVPWTTNAVAWQWTARAYDFGWQVSSSPTAGSIIDLQPWVQGAYGGGHVGVVERVLGNGHVIASSTSWGSNPYVYTTWEFVPGPGVTFISY